MKNKKIIATLCFGLVLCISIISGCSLITTNYVKYYNSTAAKISFEDGSSIKITRKELRDNYALRGFNQYVENYGYTQRQAYEATLDYIVSKKLAIRDAEKIARNASAPAGDSKTNADDVLTVKEKNYLFEKTFEAMKSNLESYIATADSSTEEEEDTSLRIKGYDKQAKLEYSYDETTGTWSANVVLQNSQLPEIETFVPIDEARNYDYEKAEDKEILFTNFQSLKTDAAHTDAYTEYLSIIKSSEKNLKLSTDAKSVFIREIDRVYKILYENLMVDKYERHYMEDNSAVTVDSVLDLYSQKVRASYTKYTASTNTSYTSDATSDIGSIYYLKDNVQWFSVSHILLKFDDAETARYNALKAEREAGYPNGDAEQTEADIEELYTNLTANVRKQLEDGSWETDTTQTTTNANDVLNVVKNSVTGATTETEMAEGFTNLIFKYNEDDGIMNAEYNYIVGVDYSTPDTTANTSYTLYSSWVDSFESAAFSLYDTGNGQIGDVYDGLIRSDYGIHIMMYMGEVNNLFTGIDSQFEVSVGSDVSTSTDPVVARMEKFENKYGALDKLYTSRLNIAVDKTYFDDLYEELIPEDSSIFQVLDLERLKEETSKITYYPKSY